jgi:hypothetical protein
MNSEVDSQKMSPIKIFLKWLIAVIVLFDLYCLSLFVLVKPCKNLGRFPYNVETLPSPRDGQPVFPGTTYVCVLDNKYNVVAYYFYWPLHQTLEMRGYWYFIKNPEARLD